MKRTFKRCLCRDAFRLCVMPISAGVRKPWCSYNRLHILNCPSAQTTSWIERRSVLYLTTEVEKIGIGAGFASKWETPQGTERTWVSWSFVRSRKRICRRWLGWGRCCMSIRSHQERLDRIPWIPILLQPVRNHGFYWLNVVFHSPNGILACSEGLIVLYC